MKRQRDDVAFCSASREGADANLFPNGCRFLLQTLSAILRMVGLKCAGIGPSHLFCVLLSVQRFYFYDWDKRRGECQFQTGLFDLAKCGGRSDFFSSFSIQVITFMSCSCLFLYDFSLVKGVTASSTF